MAGGLLPGTVCSIQHEIDSFQETPNSSEPVRTSIAGDYQLDAWIEA
jgi:hypothetical protein